MAFNLGLNSPGLVSGGIHKARDNVGSNSSYRALLATSNGSNFLKRTGKVGVISFSENSLGLLDDHPAVKSTL
jgi:hypothetical protein